VWPWPKFLSCSTAANCAEYSLRKYRGVRVQVPMRSKDEYRNTMWEGLWIQGVWSLDLSKGESTFRNQKSDIQLESFLRLWFWDPPLCKEGVSHGWYSNQLFVLIIPSMIFCYPAGGWWNGYAMHIQIYKSGFTVSFWCSFLIILEKNKTCLSFAQALALDICMFWQFEV
jgi:hypothetical protein